MTFTPHSKKDSLKGLKNKNTYLCSDGTRVTQSQINRLLSNAYRLKHRLEPFPVCECCGQSGANDNDHTISQKRCKELGKTELIWDFCNFVSSCRKCHNEWESWKSGEYKYHNNYLERMHMLSLHDHKSYNLRKNS